MTANKGRFVDLEAEHERLGGQRPEGRSSSPSPERATGALMQTTGKSRGGDAKRQMRSSEGRGRMKWGVGFWGGA
jgi:hypothetical protein